MWRLAAVFVLCARVALSQSMVEETELPRKNLNLQYPNIFILGAQKCATTVLNKMLEKHSAFCKSGTKEKHFFTDNKWLEQEKIDDFLGEFDECGKTEITMDATPSMIAEDVVPARIKASYSPDELKKKKFVVLFREPAARHYSGYQRDVRRCLMINSERGEHKKFVEKSSKLCQNILHDPPKMEDTVEWLHNAFSSTEDIQNAILTFAEWTASDYGQKQLKRGYYLHQLKTWLQVIDRSQLFIINFESMIFNTTDVTLRLSKFLGVDGDEFFRVSGEAVYNTSLAVNGTLSKKIRLPPEPASNHYMDYDKVKMDCSTYVHLEQMWAAANKGLYDFINKAPNKPPDEPYFPLFRSSRSKCYNAVWLNSPPQLKGWLNVSLAAHEVAPSRRALLRKRN